jgi:hypothetical protein
MWLMENYCNKGRRNSIFFFYGVPRTNNAVGSFYTVPWDPVVMGTCCDDVDDYCGISLLFMSRRHEIVVPTNLQLCTIIHVPPFFTLK